MWSRHLSLASRVRDWAQGERRGFLESQNFMNRTGLRPRANLGSTWWCDLGRSFFCTSRFCYLCSEESGLNDLCYLMTLQIPKTTWTGPEAQIAYVSLLGRAIWWTASYELPHTRMRQKSKVTFFSRVSLIVVTTERCNGTFLYQLLPHPLVPWPEERTWKEWASYAQHQSPNLQPAWDKGECCQTHMLPMFLFSC
jgi:hypothetical protein